MSREQKQLEAEFFAAAGIKGDLDKVKEYVGRGVDVEAEDRDLWRAIHYASNYRRLSIVKYLVEECQADVNTKINSGSTALHFATLRGHFDIVQYLVLNCEVDVNVKQNDGWTPLHFASRYGHLNIVQYLVETCDADINMTTTLGKTAHQIAHDHDKLNVAEYLTKLRESATNQSMQKTAPNDELKIINDRKSMDFLIKNPAADPIELSLNYILSCTNNLTSKVLGEGAFGKVYLGFDKELEIGMAVKRINLQVSDQNALDSIIISFKREIAVLKRFRHPNIVAMYGYHGLAGQDSQLLVYEYLTNGSLDMFLADEQGRTRLSSNVRLSIMFQLARSVHFLHTGGLDNLAVFHRDIKSGNICLTQDYTAKLIDCGLAKFVQDSFGDGLQGSVTPTMLESSGAAVFGTAGYICPVYARGQSHYTAACDVFSIGVVLTELLTGCLQERQPSHSRKNLGDFFGRYIRDDDEEPVKDGWKIMKQDADMLVSWNDYILDDLCRIAVQCMAASPKRRISTLSLVQSLGEISLKNDSAMSRDIGIETVALDSIDVQHLTLHGETDVGSKSDGQGIKDLTSELYYHCVLCNRSTCCNVTCIDGHKTCVQCVEQHIDMNIGKSGDGYLCKCGSLIHDTELYGKISIATYNCYVRERSLQQYIEQKFNEMKEHNIYLMDMIEKGHEKRHEEVMESFKDASSNIQRILGGLAYIATNSVEKCPTVVWLVPTDPAAGNSAVAWAKWARDFTHRTFDLYFVCQHSFEVEKTKMTISVSRQRLVQAAPALCVSMVLLRTALTICGIPLPFPFPQLNRENQLNIKEEFLARFMDDGTMKMLKAFKACTKSSVMSYSQSSQLQKLTGLSYEGIVHQATSMKHCHWKETMEPVPNKHGSIIWIKKKYRKKYLQFDGGIRVTV